MKTLEQAIATMEGYYASGKTRAHRNNNPGNIEYGPFARANGATDTDGRFAMFPTPEAGFSALRQLLLSRYASLTIAEAIAKYAPPNENDTALYVSSVCHWVGCNPTDTVGGVLGATNHLT